MSQFFEMFLMSLPPLRAQILKSRISLLTDRFGPRISVFVPWLEGSLLYTLVETSLSTSDQWF